MMRSRALPFVALVLASCAGAPPPAPPVMEIAPVPAAPTPAPEPGCSEAPALVAKMRAAEKEKRERCAVKAAKEALKLCPSGADASVQRVAATDAAWRGKHGPVRFLGPWLLERIEGSQEHRVWEIAASGPRLRARIESGEIALGLRDRLRVEVGDDVAFVDPRAGTVARIGLTFAHETSDYVYAGNGYDVRRLRASDLAPAGPVVPWVEGHAARPGRALLGGEVLIGDVLVSFARGAALRTGVSLAGVRPDEARVLACDQDGPAMVEADATTGRELARFALPKGMECEVAEPAYGPDPRYAFWIEQGPETKDRGRAIVVASGDTRTGKVRRFEDPSATWSIAFHSDEHLDEDGQHLCARLRSFHTMWTRCDWKLSKDGGIVRAPKPRAAPKPALSALGLAGAVDLGRAWTPAHDRLLVLSFRVKGEEKQDLRLTIAGADGKVERAVVLVAGEATFDDRLLWEPERTLEYPDLPSIEAIDGDHAIFHTGSINGLEDLVVDLRTGAVTRPCLGLESCDLAGRFAGDEKGGLRDLVSGASLVLSASDADWDAAPEVAPPCP
jgi:hypothetical protein